MFRYSFGCPGHAICLLWRPLGPPRSEPPGADPEFADRQAGPLPMSGSGSTRSTRRCKAAPYRHRWRLDAPAGRHGIAWPSTRRWMDKRERQWVAGEPQKQLGKTAVKIVQKRLADGTTRQHLYSVAVADEAPPEPMPIFSTIIRAYEASPEWGQARGIDAPPTPPTCRRVPPPNGRQDDAPTQSRLNASHRSRLCGGSA